MRFKKKSETTQSNEAVIKKARASLYESSFEQTLNELIPSLKQKLIQLGRVDAFVNNVRALISGKLDASIVSHLWFDIGDFLSHCSVHAVRHSQISMDFWVLGDTLLGGQFTRLFRGIHGRGVEAREEGGLHTDDFTLNAIVPARTAITEQRKKYRLDAHNPGVMPRMLTTFGEAYPKADVVLSLDGKGMAQGGGDEGEENLGGKEASPTLNERRERYDRWRC